MLINLDRDKLTTVPANLNNSKSEVDKLDIDKLKTVPTDLKKLSNDNAKKHCTRASIKS